MWVRDGRKFAAYFWDHANEVRIYDEYGVIVNYTNLSVKKYAALKKQIRDKVLYFGRPKNADPFSYL